eukprot:2590016-Rhodomonas_salina.1
MILRSTNSFPASDATGVRPECVSRKPWVSIGPCWATKPAGLTPAFTYCRLECGFWAPASSP